MSGMDELGKAIAEGRADFHDTMNMLTNAHIRLFGLPLNTIALQKRITLQLATATPRTTLMAHAVEADLIHPLTAVDLVVNQAMAGVRESPGDDEHAYESYRQSVEVAVTKRLSVLVERIEQSRESGLER